MSKKIASKSFRVNLENLLLLVFILSVILGCVCRSGRDNKAEKKTEEATKIASNNESNKSFQKDDGDFLVEHIEITNKNFEEIDQKVKQEKLLENAAQKLNSALTLPHDITLRAKNCGEANALFNPNDQTITVCYELMEYFYKTFKSKGNSDEKAYQSMYDAVRFVFLHELGHALIDAYHLPITGNEEDAADRLSSYICLEEMGDEGVRSAMAAAEVLSIQAKNGSPNKKDFYDEHLLDEQRFYNILCMIYGSDAEKHSDIVKKNFLPKERAVRCINEYERTSKSWKDLLKPFRKN